MNVVVNVSVVKQITKCAQTVALFIRRRVKVDGQTSHVNPEVLLKRNTHETDAIRELTQLKRPRGRWRRRGEGVSTDLDKIFIKEFFCFVIRPRVIIRSRDTTYGHLHVAMCEQKNEGKGSESSGERGTFSRV